MQYTQFEKDELISCMTMVAAKVAEPSVCASKRNLNAVSKKYGHTKYGRVSSEIDNPRVSDVRSNIKDEETREEWLWQLQSCSQLKTWDSHYRTFLHVRLDRVWKEALPQTPQGVNTIEFCQQAVWSWLAGFPARAQHFWLLRRDGPVLLFHHQMFFALNSNLDFVRTVFTTQLNNNESIISHSLSSALTDVCEYLSFTWLSKCLWKHLYLRWFFAFVYRYAALK